MIGRDSCKIENVAKIRLGTVGRHLIHWFSGIDADPPNILRSSYKHNENVILVHKGVVLETNHFASDTTKGNRIADSEKSLQIMWFFLKNYQSNHKYVLRIC